MRLFSIAAVLGLAGIGFEKRWMTGAAIVILLAGFGLRFLPGDGETRDDEDDDEEDGDD